MIDASGRSRARALGRPGLWLALLVLAWSAGELRRSFIRTFFRDGPPGRPPALDQPVAASTPLPQVVAMTRVLLIDGLDDGAARQLPVLNALCGRGLDLRVDVGFPTVSLPVQAALWTGLTQQQSGLLYRTGGLPLPLAGGLPSRMPGSVAIVEDQGFIAGSFGFTSLTQPPSSPDGAPFTQAALEAVAGSAPLVFVHLLRVDKAGHKGGTRAPAYADAARSADALLGALLVAAPAAPDRRWWVLSDHGHRPGGGHGGSEPGVRIVRACVEGGPTARPSGGGPVHLVDLSRALHESVGLSPPAGAVGRPLPFALQHPSADATLPRPSRLALVLAAGALLLAALAAFGGRSPARLFVQALWLPLAYVAAALGRGVPTLSNPMIYPPLGRDMLLGALPGLLLLGGLAALTTAGASRSSSSRVRLWLMPPERSWWGALAIRQPLSCAALALACLLACEGLPALVSSAASPPLYPGWTAHAVFFLAMLQGAASALALGLLLGWSWALPWRRVLSRLRPGAPAGR